MSASLPIRTHLRVQHSFLKIRYDGRIDLHYCSSGFIGSATAVEALKSGYRWRLCLRGPCEKLELLLSKYSQHVEFVIVPDLTNEAGFAGQLEAVDYVVHVASPLPHRIDKEHYFTPAVKMITAVLREAAKVVSVKKM